LTYSDDKDRYNEAYQNAIGKIYGEQRVQFDSDFTKGEELRQLKHAATPVGAMRAFDGFAPFIDVVEPSMKPRLLYFIGEIPTDWVYIQESDGTLTLLSVYGAAHHTDDVRNPSFDINFGVCDFYFYPDLNITLNNNFNRHYRRMVQQINEGRMMKAYFDLSEEDIRNIKLNDKIYVDNSWWIINEFNYDGSTDAPAIMELISLDNGTSIRPKRNSDITENGGLPAFGLTQPVRPNIGDLASLIDDGSFNASPNRNVYGGNNDDVIIAGRDNTVQNGVRSSMIIGDNNDVTERSLVIGDNLIVTERGAHVQDLYVQGRFVKYNQPLGFEEKYYERTLTNAEVLNLFTTPLVITQAELGVTTDTFAAPTRVITSVFVPDPTAPYTGSQRIQLEYAPTNTFILLLNLSDNQEIILDNFSSTRYLPNQSWVIKPFNSDPTGGAVDNKMVIRIFYRVYEYKASI
jgi:hypothetical protein